MKIRSNYVSNSSSSSFIVSEDLSSRGVACIKLSLEQKKLINGSIVNEKEFKLDNFNKKDYYLTQFISDCCEKELDEINKVKVCYYSGGELSERPYLNQFYNEYKINGDISVFLLKEHDEAKQMTFNKFAKDFKTKFGNVDVLVKYDGKGVYLTYVE